MKSLIDTQVFRNCVLGEAGTQVCKVLRPRACEIIGNLLMEWCLLSMKGQAFGVTLTC